MFKNYLTTAWRHLQKNLLYSFIMIGGLAIGIGLTLCVVSYVANEYSFDRFNEQSERIVKVELSQDGKAPTFTTPMSYRFAEAVASKTPEIKDFARIHEKSNGSVLIEDERHRKFYEPNFLFADQGVFRMFSFDFLDGDARSALENPGSVVLTESIAKKYFGTIKVVGRQITYDKKHPLTVTGVIKDVPANSSIQFDFIADISTIRSIETSFFHSIMPEKQATTELEGIGATGPYHSYFLLSEQANLKSVEAKIPATLTTAIPTKSNKLQYFLVPLTNLHFEIISPDTLLNARIFSLIAILILVLAVVNYINLSTAQAFERAKEIFMRKITGASRKMLIMQIYVESVLYITIAFITGCGLFLITQSQLSGFFTLDFGVLTSRYILVPFAGTYLLTIILSGTYPAFVISGNEPLQGIKNQNSVSGGTLRKILITFQFVICTSLILAFVIIHSQLNLLLEKNTGIHTDQVLRVNLSSSSNIQQHYSAIRQDIEKLSGIKSVTGSALSVYGENFSLVKAHRLQDSIKKTDNVYFFRVDDRFIPTMGIDWATRPSGNVSNPVVINETMARQLGISSANYDQPLDIGFDSPVNIMGIVKDFHFTSMQSSIHPMMLSVENQDIFRENLYVRLSDKVSSANMIENIKQVYSRYEKDKPFEYSFMSDDYRRLYEKELKTGYILFGFMSFAILIAIMGLFGLSTYTALRRRKEIAVRKVLGASSSSVFYSFSLEAVKLVTIACFIAVPLSYLVMHNWLNQYATHIAISWQIIGFSCILVLIVAWITVGFNALKAAITNPAAGLKTS